MFGFWSQIEKIFNVDFVSGGVDVYASYGFILCSWILFNAGMRIYIKLSKKK